jgi:hypothetical protein
MVRRKDTTGKMARASCVLNCGLAVIILGTTVCEEDLPFFFDDGYNSVSK